MITLIESIGEFLFLESEHGDIKSCGFFKSRPNHLIFPAIFTQTTLEKGIYRYTVTTSTLAGRAAQQDQVCRAA